MNNNVRVILPLVFSFIALLFIFIFFRSTYFDGTAENSESKSKNQHTWANQVRNGYGGPVILCGWMIALLYVVSRRIRTAQQFHEMDQPRARDWRLEYPVIAIASCTVSRDYSNITSTTPSAPTPSQTALLDENNDPNNAPPPKYQPPPPKYQPPPSYNECMLNVPDDVHPQKSPLSV